MITLVRGDAAHLPLPDGCVDLVVTSPPYFALRSYQDNGEHYAGQIGSEATPGEFIDALIACTAEWVRVLKPAGSLWVNLGDKYAQDTERSRNGHSGSLVGTDPLRTGPVYSGRRDNGVPRKSLMGLPWRYALRCVDDLGLILRAEVIWSKPNGLPESVTDRVRRSHEQWFHLVKQPRYYAAVDTIREEHAPASLLRFGGAPRVPRGDGSGQVGSQGWGERSPEISGNPLGKLPGSVWSIPSQPLTVPAELGVDHFACVDEETEILTTRGWLRHRQLEVGDSVAGYDLASNTALWTNCTAIHRYHHYDSDMIAVESRDLSMRLTPNHRAIVQRMETRSKRRNPVHTVRADELERSHFIPRSADWQQFGDFHYGARAAAVLGWVASDGWYQGRCVYVSQSLTVNAPHVADIDKLIPDSTRSERQRVYKGSPWTDVTWRLGDIMATIVQQAMPDKLLPWWLVTSTEEERRAVLDAFIAGDGHRRTDGRISVYQKHRQNLDVLQAIAVTLGYKTTLSKSADRFVLYLTEGGRSVTLRGTSGVGSKVRREEYTGLVWCPTTETGTFIARRNGSVFITGNSFPMEWPRRIILGWSPREVCTACSMGHRLDGAHEGTSPNHNGMAGRVQARTGMRGLRSDDGTTGLRPPGQDDETVPDFAAARLASGTAPVGDREVRRSVCAVPYEEALGRGDEGTAERMETAALPMWATVDGSGDVLQALHQVEATRRSERRASSVGAAYCTCPPGTPTRPSVILDPFGGTGTVALVADVLGRHGISVDMSADYSRLARWRTSDAGERARAMQVDKPEAVPDGQMQLFA